MAITTTNFASLVSLVTRLADKELTTDELYSILDRVQAIVNYNAAPAAEPPKVDLVPLFNALCEGKKIEAIEMHRMLTGFGLKESKDEIERVISGVLTVYGPKGF